MWIFMQLLCIFSSMLTFNIFLKKIKVAVLHPLQKLPRTAGLREQCSVAGALYGWARQRLFCDCEVYHTVNAQVNRQVKNYCLQREKEDKVIMEEGMLLSFGLCEAEDNTQWWENPWGNRLYSRTIQCLQPLPV